MRFNWIVAASLTAALAVTGCGGGGSSSKGGSNGNPIPVVSPSPGASSAPSEALFACPTSDTASAAARANAGTLARARRLPRRAPAAVAPLPSATQLVAVTYERARAASARAAIAAAEVRAGATFRREFDFPHIGLHTRIVAVPRASLAQALAALRAQPGVRSVGLAGARRYPLAVTSPYYPNDPYFTGFANPIPVDGAAQGSTYELLPYAESANVPGQWNLHATQLEHAFAYSQSGNGSNVSNPNALGSASIKIAIVDTGADTSQPDLGSKIAYQRCFITDPNGNQSTSNFVTDADGHGTDVSAIAGAVTGNGLGFTAEGGNSVLYEYRVNPTPDSVCDDLTSTASECTADVDDVVDAIDDAVSRGVNVISLSLGSYGSDDGKSSGCSSNGVDGDTEEGNAVADAVAAGTVVVAAAGNDGTQALTAPACDTNVIAVGASALADGSPNGAGNSNGSSVAPIEYVAHYSSYGSPGAAFRNPSAWGIVAPGGDPANGKDYDDLHWVYDLWTSTPYDSNDEGDCSVDYPGTGSTTECRTFIAGTSMATPTVAGAAALILAVNGAYRTAGRMKTLLCDTADDLGDAREGCGRLNIYRAMAVALGDTTPP